MGFKYKFFIKPVILCQKLKLQRFTVRYDNTIYTPGINIVNYISIDVNVSLHYVNIDFVYLINRQSLRWLVPT